MQQMQQMQKVNTGNTAQMQTQQFPTLFQGNNQFGQATTAPGPANLGTKQKLPPSIHTNPHLVSNDPSSKISKTNDYSESNTKTFDIDKVKQIQEFQGIVFLGL